MTAFVSYGSFWLTLVAMLILPKLGLASAPPAGFVGCYLLMWGLFTALMFIGTLKSNKVLQFIFGSLAVLFFLLAAEHWLPEHAAHLVGHRIVSGAVAIGQMHEEALPKGKKCHVVDCDLQAFFDTVDHQKLMGKLRESIADPRVLKLILKYLKAGVILRNGCFEDTDKGVPQGGPLSPLLANILLDELDHELEKRGHLFVRYADDFVILCNSPRAGQRILTSIKSYLKKTLRLIVNETKSKVVSLQEATFLGFSIVRKKIRWTEKSQKKFKAEVRRLTKRTRGHSPVKVIADLQAYLRGAVNYYVIGIPFRDIRELDQWVRRRMRLYYWKQWGRPRTRRRKLLRLGIGKDEVHKASRARKGHWRMSQMSLVRWAMNNAWLEEQGLPSLEKQWCSIRYPNGPKGAKG